MFTIDQQRLKHIIDIGSAVDFECPKYKTQHYNNNHEIITNSIAGKK